MNLEMKDLYKSRIKHFITFFYFETTFAQRLSCNGAVFYFLFHFVPGKEMMWVTRKYQASNICLIDDTSRKSACLLLGQ